MNQLHALMDIMETSAHLYGKESKPKNRYNLDRIAVKMLVGFDRYYVVKVYSTDLFQMF